jgi:hypothetical protein
MSIATAAGYLGKTFYAANAQFVTSIDVGTGSMRKTALNGTAILGPLTYIYP